MITDEVLEKMKTEQAQELFESIRHFGKYRAIGQLTEKMVIPDHAIKIHDELMKLYQDEFEKKEN